VRAANAAHLSARSNLIPFLSRRCRRAHSTLALAVSFSKRAQREIRRRPLFNSELRNLRLLTPNSRAHAEQRNGTAAAERLCLLEFRNWFRTKGRSRMSGRDSLKCIYESLGKRQIIDHNQHQRENPLLVTIKETAF
jgi:hypothetical protein